MQSKYNSKSEGLSCLILTTLASRDSQSGRTRSGCEHPFGKSSEASI